MATDNTAPDLHERVHSHVWWKVKTGWTDAQYFGRKNALLIRIREEWPNKTEKLKSNKITDGIESLVATFDDRAWCLKIEDDETMRFEEQLRLYSKWAAVIHSERVKLPEGILYGISMTTMVAARNPQSELKVPFELDNVEVCFDVRFATTFASKPATGLLHTLMISLRDISTDVKVPSNWSEFKWTVLHSWVKASIGYTEKAILHVYWIRGNQWTWLRSDGDYSVMLKRISETCRQPYTLRLLITEQYPPNLVKPTLCLGPRPLARDEDKD